MASAKEHTSQTSKRATVMNPKPAKLIDKSQIPREPNISRLPARIRAKIWADDAEDKRNRDKWTTGGPKTGPDFMNWVKSGNKSELMMYMIHNPNVYALAHETIAAEPMDTSRASILLDDAKEQKAKYQRLPKGVAKLMKQSDREEYDMKHGGPKTLEELTKWVNEGKSEDVAIYASRNPTVRKLLDDSKAFFDATLKALELAKNVSGSATSPVQISSSVIPNMESMLHIMKRSHSV